MADSIGPLLWWVAVLMTVLDLMTMILRVRTKQQADQGAGEEIRLIVADLMADVSFFIGFLVYPSTSTAIFMFFMSETFEGPGEDGLAVMTYDRSIETDSELYRAFMPYALIMLLIFPIGTPLQVALIVTPNHTASEIVP
eukprot:2500189-Prymnesium_polylepis.1